MVEAGGLEVDGEILQLTPSMMTGIMNRVHHKTNQEEEVAIEVSVINGTVVLAKTTIINLIGNREVQGIPG